MMSTLAEISMATTNWDSEEACQELMKFIDICTGLLKLDIENQRGMKYINIDVFPAMLPDGKETLEEDDRGYIRIRDTVTGAHICSMRTYRTKYLLV